VLFEPTKQRPHQQLHHSQKTWKPDLCQCHFITSPEERRRVMQQWLNLLLHGLHQLVALLLLLFFSPCPCDLEHERIDLRKVSVDKEVDLCPEERSGGRGMGGWEEV